jgi:hypothetical protein
MKLDKKIFILIFLAFSSCGLVQQHANLKFKVKLLNTIIERYIGAVSRKYDSSFDITINSEKSNDTVSISIVNASPDLSMAKFYGLYNFLDCHIYLIGDSSIYDFFEIKKDLDVPKEVVERERQFNEAQKMTLSVVEPRRWVFYYRNAKLVDFFPNDQIKTSCPECKIQ